MAAPKRDYISRRRPADTAATIKAYSRIVGEVAINWNAAHVATLQALEWILKDAGTQVGRAIWHSLKSDDAQRSVTIAAAHSASTKEFDAIFKRNLIWAVKELGRLSCYRNDAMHAAVEFRGKDATPDSIGVDPARFQRLTALSQRKLFILLAGDLRQLAAFITAIWFDHGILGIPLPKKPQLQVLRYVAKSPPKKNSQKPQLPKQKRPPQPSRV